MVRKKRKILDALTAGFLIEINYLYYL